MFQAYVRRVPRVDVAGAIALGRALVGATELVPRLSEPILRAKRLLAKRLNNLTTAAQEQLRHHVDKRSPIAVAGRNLDAAWMALHEWLEAIAALPGHCSEGRSAVEALVSIFPEGFDLVRPPPLLEWADSEARLARIQQEGLQATLNALGGGPFVETLKGMHAAYARALGDTVGGALSSRAVKRSLDASVLAIHAYVTCVVAELYDGGPEATTQAFALLAPPDFAQSSIDSRAAFFETTLEAYPPPPPMTFDAWEEERAMAM
jgi:hypothetical protein